MKKETLDLICCPVCRSRLTLHEGQTTDNEIINGVLECRTCRRSYGVTDGVARLVTDWQKNNKALAKSWGYEWSKVTDGKLEKGTYYGETEDQEVASFLKYMGITAADLHGKRVLDAGCGCGRLTRALGRYGARVVGIDIASSIERIYDNCRSETNVDIVQANFVNPPFPDASFDYISCKLALCYVPRPGETFKTLSALVKPSGRLFISMPDRADPAFTVRLKEFVRITHRLPKSLLLYLCWGLAPALWLGRKLTRKPGDSLRTNVFLLVNALHSRFTLHTLEEVRGWFQGVNFAEVTTVPGMAHSVNVRGTRE